MEREGGREDERQRKKGREKEEKRGGEDERHRKKGREAGRG